MKYLGFSTGAIAYGDFNKALEILSRTTTNAIELSALRRHELEPLVAAANNLDLKKYKYVSVHAPGKYEADDEINVVKLLETFANKDWPIVLHPDTIYDYSLWRNFGELLLIENMDKRKTGGRSCVELDNIFQKLPDARFCFDIAHSRQYDSTMSEALTILTKYRSLLTQIHISDVDANCRHNKITDAAIKDYVKLSSLISQDVAIIIETIMDSGSLEDEMNAAAKSMSATICHA